MKELDSFTVERLEEWINTPEKYDHRYSPRINCDELRALARIALAAKRAEPVAWWTGPEPTLTGELESLHDHETGSHYLPLISLSTTSYAALSREKFIIKVTNFLCARRKCIAKEGETAALIYDLVTPPQLHSPEIPEGWISIPRDMLADYRDVKNAEVENYKARFAGYYDREGTRWARDFADLCEELTAIDKVLAAAPEKPL